MFVSRSRVPGVAVLLVLALATRVSALSLDEEAEVDRRLREEFGVRKFDPERDYGPEGFLADVDAAAGLDAGSHVQRTDARGRRLLLPLGFAGMLTGIQTAVKVFSTIVSFFGKTYTEQLVASHLDNGYNDFRTSSEAMTLAGLHHDNIEPFLGLLATKFGMVGDEKTIFIENNRWAGYTLGGKDWHDERYVFSVGKGGMARSASVYINNDKKKKKMNVLWINSKTEFELAPEVFVILCSTTQFWNTKHSIRYEKRPANIKMKDIEFVTNYGNMIAIQLLAEMAGLDAPKNPNFKKYEKDMLPEPEATSVRLLPPHAEKSVAENWEDFEVKKFNKATKQFDEVERPPVVAAPNGNPFRRPVVPESGKGRMGDEYSQLYDEDDEEEEIF